MKVKKILALLMSAATMITMFAACGKGDGESKDGETTTTTVASAVQNNKPVEIDITKGITAKKIGSYKKNEDVSFSSPTGVVYETADGEFGIISADGKHDTGAIYTSCGYESEYFVVSKTDYSKADSIDDFNADGMVDANGKEIIPMGYTSFTRINDRYYRADKITEITENEEEALVYFSDDKYQTQYKEGDVLCKGTWEIYDMETGKTVPGATGTKAYKPSANGFALEYTTDSKQVKKVGPGGNAIPSNARILENDCYSIQSDKKVTVYDAYGAKLFEYTGESYVSVYAAGKDRFAIHDSSKKYFIVDKSGKAISKEFDSSINSSTEEFIISNGRIYDYNGNLIVDGDYHTIQKDSVTNGVWYISGNDGKALIKYDGTALFQCKNNDGVGIYSTHFAVSRNSDGLYYSFADKDYVIDGNSVAPWLIRAQSEDGSDAWLVDTLSGKKIIEGYSYYYAYEANGKYYIHATSYELDSVDVYEISKA